jgi:hypothetical protein
MDGPSAAASVETLAAMAMAGRAANRFARLRHRTECTSP